MTMDVLQQQAAHAQTAPERLRQIFESSPPLAVLRDLAQNPNTPSDVLWLLATRFPRDVLDNPVLPLLHLENSDLGDTLPESAALGFLCLDDLPFWMLDAFLRGSLSRSAPVRAALDQHWQTRGEAAPHWKSSVQTAIAKLAEEESVRLNRIWSYSGNTQKVLLERALRLRFVPTWLAAPLATELEQKSRSAPSGVQTAAQPFQEKLEPQPEVWRNEPPGETVGDKKSVALAALNALHLIHTAQQAVQEARYPALATHTSVSDLERLAEKDQKARRRLSDRRLQSVRDENVSHETLRILATDTTRVVRIAVARHPRTPLDALELFATDEDAWVRGALARNERLPVELLEQLAGDTHCVVRANIARHPGASFALLQQLAGDADGEVLDALIHRRDLPQDLAEAVAHRRRSVSTWGSSRPPRQLARDPQTPPEVLAALLQANKEDKTVRRHVARHPQTPAASLQDLAADSAVRADVATNPSAPPSLLRELAADKIFAVQVGVAGNPHTPLECLLRFVEEDIPLESPLRSALASNRTLPLPALEKLLEKFTTCLENTALQALRSQASWLPASPQAARYPYHRRQLAEDTQKAANFSALLSHPNASRELRHRVRNLHRYDVLLSLAISDYPFERTVALACTQTPVEVLEEHIYAPDWMWRLAIARNPATPRVILQTLARDGNHFVRAWAAERLQSQTAQHDFTA